MQQPNSVGDMFTTLAQAMKPVNEPTLPTNKGYLTASQIKDELTYGSYAANRSYGMKHEALVRIGIGNDAMKERYESETK